jgi:hypothetical protein
VQLHTEDGIVLGSRSATTVAIANEQAVVPKNPVVYNGAVAYGARFVRRRGLWSKVATLLQLIAAIDASMRMILYSRVECL